jgi:hypothetical protein
MNDFLLLALGIVILVSVIYICYILSFAELLSEVFFREAAEMEIPSFEDWLYSHYIIGNSHTLTRLLENTEIQLQYLREFNLPEDTEL